MNQHRATYLHFLHHLLAEGADLGGDGDGHVLSAAVLAADAVERPGPVLHPTAVQVRLPHAHAQTHACTRTHRHIDTDTHMHTNRVRRIEFTV